MILLKHANAHKHMKFTTVMYVRTYVAKHNIYSVRYVTLEFFLVIKTHNSESRGQEETGCTRRMSVLFTGSTAVKFVNALN